MEFDIFYCDDSCYIYEYEHCARCNPFRFSSNRAGRREETKKRKKLSSTHSSSSPHLTTHPSPPSRFSLHQGGQNSSFHSGPSSFPSLSQSRGKGELYFCEEDSWVYEYEHCFQCNPFLVKGRVGKENALQKGQARSPSLKFLPSAVKSNLVSAFSQGVRLPFESIPVVDVQELVQASSAAEAMDVAKEIGKACHDVGFLYIKNHGIPSELLEEVFKVSQLFFDLPHEKKMKTWIGNSKNHRGYFPLKEEALSTTGDLKEGLDLGPDHIKERIDGLRGPNQWPLEDKDFDVGFQETLKSYFGALTSLARCLLRGIALSLGLDWKFFEDKTNDPMAALRLLHYPPQAPATVQNSCVGCGAHTDYGCLTILAQDNVGGLQVWSGHRWVAAPPIPNTFVVNIGDMTSMWTNGTYPATVHRVVNVSGKNRYSVPFFFNPDYETVVESLPGTVTSKRPAEYPPIKAGDHLKKRFDSSFTYREGENAPQN